VLRKVLLLLWCTQSWANPTSPLSRSSSVPVLSGIQAIRQGLRVRQMLRGGNGFEPDNEPPTSEQTLAQLASSEEEEAKLLGLLRMRQSSQAETAVSQPQDAAESKDLEITSARQLLQNELPLLFKRPSSEFSEFSYLPEVFRYLTRSNNPNPKIRISTSQFTLKVENKRIFNKFCLMDLPSLFPAEIQDSAVLASCFLYFLCRPLIHRPYLAQQFYSEETEMLDFRSMMIRVGASGSETSAQNCELKDGDHVHAQLLFADEGTGVITWAFRPVDKHSEKPGDSAMGRVRLDRILCSPVSENPPFESSICWTTIMEDSESHRYVARSLCNMLLRITILFSRADHPRRG
jgi:hypothetical protein